MKRFLKLSLMLACMLGAPLILNESADALAQTEPAAPAMFGVGGFNDQFNAPTSVSRLYVPGGGNGSVTIHAVQSFWNFDDLDIYTVTDVGDASGPCNYGNRVANYTGALTNHNSYADYTLGGINGATDVQGGYRVYCVVTRVDSTAVMSFRLTAGAGQLIGNDVSTNGGTTGYLGSAQPTPSSPNWSRELDFAPNCGVTGSNHNIWFYDLDLQLNTQGTITARVRQTGVPPNDNYGALGGDAPGSPQTYADNDGGDHETRPMTITFNQGGARKYRLNIGPIAGNNAIKIALPFDQIYTVINCPPPTNVNDQPSLTLVQDCNNNRVRVTSTDPDGNGYTIRWSTASAVAAQSGTAVSRNADGYFYINLGTTGRFSAVTVYVYTAGTNPPNPAPATSTNSASITYGACVQATCTVTPSTTAYLNQPVTASFTIRNTGANNGRTWVAADNLSLVRGASGSTVEVDHNTTTGVGSNWSFSRSVTPTAVGNDAVAFRVRFDSTDIANCLMDVYYRSPTTATLTCNISPPGLMEADMSGTVTMTATYTGPVNAAPTGNFTAATLEHDSQAARAPNSPAIPTSVSRGGTATYTFNNYPFGPPGMRDWTGRVTIQTANGVGGLYTVLFTCTEESPVGNLPYFKEFGGDVQAGGVFAPTPCSPMPTNRGGIYAFNKGTAAEGYAGASAQLTVTSLLTINGFASAGFRSGATNTIPPRGLSFANNAAATASYYGGNFGAGQCVKNYFVDTRDESLEPSGTYDFPASGSMADPAPIYENPVKNVFVPANTPTATTVDVDPGRTYRVTVSGRWSNSNGGTEVDAFCDHQISAPSWINDTQTTFQINNTGNQSGWATSPPAMGNGAPAYCSANYTYSRTVTAPASGTLSFRIFDGNPATNAAQPSWYADNSGGLQVGIAPTNVAITASSQTPAQGMEALRAYDGVSNVWGAAEWATVGEQHQGAAPPAGGTWVRFTFPSAREVGRVVLFDRVNPHDRAMSGYVSFSNGANIPFNALDNSNNIGTELTFTPRNVSWVQVNITSTSGGTCGAGGTCNAGLGEVQIHEVSGYDTVPQVVPTGRHQLYFDGNKIIGSTNDTIIIPAGSQTAVYVGGNAYIRSNIELAQSGYTSNDDIPYFALVVCGNIYIDNDVTRLDGVYIAQPGTYSNGVCTPPANPITSTSGTIYTCATGTVRCPHNALTTMADEQLSINGSLIANRIKWLRSYCSLRFSSGTEALNFGTGAGNTTCTNSGNSKAAEIVNYTPQMWLAPSPLAQPEDGDASNPYGPYDFIRTLPPVLSFGTATPPVGGGGGGGTPTCATGTLWNGQCYVANPQLVAWGLCGSYPVQCQNQYCPSYGGTWTNGPNGVFCYSITAPAVVSGGAGGGNGLGGGGCESC